MNYASKIFLAAAALSAAFATSPALAGGSCGSGTDAKAAVQTSNPGTHAQAANIVQTAVAAGEFKTLAAALGAAGLVETLSGKGPFTVFAPTDAAFAKLPKGTVEDLLKPENRGKLIAILTYHVVPGTVEAKDVVKLKTARTVNGKDLAVVANAGGVQVGGAKVTQTDIDCSNGVIHVIDTVMIPS